jgi:hypothetical protein
MATIPPRIEPTRWEEYPGFRETFLLYFTEPPHDVILRGLAMLLYDLALEHCHLWPAWPESSTASELRAALADLRHLQGYLAEVGKERVASHLGNRDIRLSRLALRLAPELSRIGDEIESALDGNTSGQ